MSLQAASSCKIQPLNFKDLSSHLYASYLYNSSYILTLYIICYVFWFWVEYCTRNRSSVSCLLDHTCLHVGYRYFGARPCSYCTVFSNVHGYISRQHTQQSKSFWYILISTDTTLTAIKWLDLVDQRVWMIQKYNFTY